MTVLRPDTEYAIDIEDQDHHATYYRDWKHLRRPPIDGVRDLDGLGLGNICHADGSENVCPHEPAKQHTASEVGRQAHACAHPCPVRPEEVDARGEHTDHRQKNNAPEEI